MKKSLIALAVAATLVAPVAMADTSNVTVYGAANVSLDLAKSGNSGNDVSTNHVASNSSLIGFKGSEDLGGGLSAIFQVESGIDIDAGGNSLATRETFGGLKGDSWGSVRLGKIDTPYKNSTRGLDLFGDGIADNRSLMGDSVGSHFDRTSNTLAYTSPAMSGLSLAYAHAFGAETASATTDVKGKADSFAVMYDMAPFYATVANQKTTYGTGGTGSIAGTAGNTEKAFKVGGSFKTDMFAVNLVIENTKDTVASTGVDTKVNNIYVAGQYNISSSDAVKLAVTRTGDMKVAGVTSTSSGAKQLTVGYDHMMSKRTTVYALYTKLSNSTNGTYELTGAGTSSAGSTSTANAKPSALSVGLKHSF